MGLKQNIWRKIWNIAKYIMIPAAALFLFNKLFLWADDVAMGNIADWVDKKFSYEYVVPTEDGKEMLVHNYEWLTMKDFLLEMLLMMVLAGSVLFILVSDVSRRRHKRENARQIAGYIDRFILNDEPFPADIPVAYGEVFAKLSEVKYQEKQREQTLRDETARKDELVTYLAHDLKTPLTSVIGYLTLLVEEPDLSEKMRARYLSVAVKKAGRLEQLINELFEITRYNIHHVELQMSTVNLSVMTEQMVYEFRPALAEKNLTFRTELQPNVNIYCDVDKMERVIDNLIRNAIHYSDRDSEIAVTLKRECAKKLTASKNDNPDDCGELEKYEAVLTVTNRGKTIPKEKLNRIFEQFYRMDSSRNSETGGTGLGLAIAKQLVEAHGGSITALSENERIQFEVRMPA